MGKWLGDGRGKRWQRSTAISVLSSRGHMCWVKYGRIYERPGPGAGLAFGAMNVVHLRPNTRNAP